MENSVGYVHNVSPKKTSKKGMKYFQFDLQTDSQQFTKTVCFDTKIHDSLNDYMVSGTPVKLKNVQRKQSIINPHENDIIMNKRSKIEEASNVDVTFESTPAPAKSCKFFTVQQISDLDQGCTVSIKGLLSAPTENLEIIQKNDSALKLLRGAITDYTGTIKIRLWDAHSELADGSSYTFENLKVREFNGQKFLTTSPYTKESLIDETFPNPCEDEVHDLTTVTVNSFKMVSNFSTWFTCLNCSKTLTDVSTLKTAKCSNCKSIMLLGSCPKLMSVRVAVDDPSNERQQ